MTFHIDLYQIRLRRVLSASKTLHKQRSDGKRRTARSTKQGNTGTLEQLCLDTEWITRLRYAAKAPSDVASCLTLRGSAGRTASNSDGKQTPSSRRDGLER